MTQTVTQQKTATFVDPAANPLAVLGLDFGVALDQIIEREAHAVKVRDDYECTMVAVGRAVVLLHEAVIAKARGTPKPQEVNEYKRWMDYRGPEWFDLLAAHGKTVEWATRIKQWDVDLVAAQGRRNIQNQQREERHENHNQLIESIKSPVGAYQPSSPPAKRQEKSVGNGKTVSIARLNTEYAKIDRLLARVDEEDRAEALEILEICFIGLKDLVSA